MKGCQDHTDDGEVQGNGSQVIPEGQRGLVGPVREPAAIAAAGTLAALAHAVDRDLSTPDHSAATARAYADDWADFRTFCDLHGLAALPAAPQTVALYLKALEERRSRTPAALASATLVAPGLALSTLRRRLAAIASRHATEGLESRGCSGAVLEAVARSSGPAFRSFDLRGQLTDNRLDPRDVARIVQRRSAAAAIIGDFAGHSLRRGFITNAAKKKVPIESIKRVTGQRSNTIVLGYVAAATIDEDPPLLEIVGAGGRLWARVSPAAWIGVSAIGAVMRGTFTLTAMA